MSLDLLDHLPGHPNCRECLQKAVGMQRRWRVLEQEYKYREQGADLGQECDEPPEVAGLRLQQRLGCMKDELVEQ